MPKTWVNGTHVSQAEIPNGNFRIKFINGKHGELGHILVAVWWINMFSSKYLGQRWKAKNQNKRCSCYGKRKNCICKLEESRRKLKHGLALNINLCFCVVVGTSYNKGEAFCPNNQLFLAVILPIKIKKVLDLELFTKQKDHLNISLCNLAKFYSK